jgi:hypothetical protein
LIETLGDNEMVTAKQMRDVKDGKASLCLGFVSYNEDKPESIAENAINVIEWVKNPLNKIKVKLYKNSVLLTGNTYEFKEDFKKFFNASFNKTLKGCLVFPSNECFNDLVLLAK